MKFEIKFLGRTIENNEYRFNVNGFKNERTLIGASFKKKDMNLKDIRDAFLYCIMSYNWLEKHFL